MSTHTHTQRDKSLKEKTSTTLSQMLADIKTVNDDSALTHFGNDQNIKRLFRVLCRLMDDTD